MIFAVLRHGRRGRSNRPFFISKKTKNKITYTDSTKKDRRTIAASYV